MLLAGSFVQGWFCICYSSGMRVLLKNNLVVGVVAAVLVLGISATLFAASTGGRTDAGTVAAQDFIERYQKDERAVLLDVRTASEYAEGYLPDAVHIDFYAPDFKEKIAQLDKEKTYYLYCRSGNRSGKTLAMMRELGFSTMFDAAGGIAALEAAGVVLVK